MKDANVMVSVVIPNYNHAQYLPQRIESVLQQTLQDFEIIILDDCSLDNSREIIEQYVARDSRISAVYNDYNSGSTFKQWNKGFGLAKGDYIWIAESDDFAAPELLESLVKCLGADEEIGLAYCDSWHVYEEKGSKERNFEMYEELDPALWTRNFTVEGIKLVRKFMCYRNIIPNASAVLLRRKVVQQVGPSNEKLKLVGDWLYWASILAVSKVSFIAEPLNYYRHHNSSVRSQTLINGIYFVELTHLIHIIQRYGEPDHFFFTKMIDSILKMWFKGMIEYKIPMRRHYAIFKNLNSLNRNYRYLFIREFKKFLFANRLSGLRQLLGDVMLYPLLKRFLRRY